MCIFDSHFPFIFGYHSDVDNGNDDDRNTSNGTAVGLKERRTATQDICSRQNGYLFDILPTFITLFSLVHPEISIKTH